MALNDTLSTALSKIMDYEKTGKKQLEISPTSKVIKKVLDIMNENNYAGKYALSKTNQGETLKLELLGKINKCGVIKPRFSVRKDGFEKFEKRFLPAQNFGLLIISTPQGIMAHEEARKKGIGGKLLAFVY
ncbi:MAG: 30S ribosomal protein S8 [Nanoarchaeota archaeon]|jgi:small subunit ribosomal protein S8|nr:30S ribosomal protein S8 [Nanoarchaeota archaeon]|tara:strand:- start:24980 stop:25372 length:393 start_codon:yes stop_codon:yes gene_type:complete